MENIKVWVAEHKGRIAKHGSYHSTENRAWFALTVAADQDYTTLKQKGWTIRPAILDFTKGHSDE